MFIYICMYVYMCIICVHTCNMHKSNFLKRIYNCLGHFWLSIRVVIASTKPPARATPTPQETYHGICIVISLLGSS